MTDGAVRKLAGAGSERDAPPASVVDHGEARTMRAVAAGDRHACEQLVTIHLARIVAFAERMLGDHHDAEDVAQETFARLWQHAGRWQPGRARLTTWLHRVASNLCIDRLRRRRERTLDDAAAPPDPGPGPAERTGARELERQVRSALLALPERQRLALTLCHYQGLRQDEAATIMEVTVEALESLLARGRRTMRAQLSDVAADLLGRDA